MSELVLALARHLCRGTILTSDLSTYNKVAGA